jgi:hypothetical protein
MHIDIPHDFEPLLLDVAKKLAQKPCDVILCAIQRYLEDQLDYHVGIQGYQRYLACGRQGTSLEDIKKELGFENE